MASIIDEILNKVNIVDVISSYIDLQKKGRNYWGICPFHDDSNPSMSVSPEKQFFKCFVCGHGGNVISFVSDYEKISFGKSLQKLAEKVGLEIENNFDPKPKYNEQQTKLVAALNDANDFFQYAITNENAKEFLQYAEDRGLDNKIREKFSIGFAPNDNSFIDFLIKKGHDEATLINASLITQNKRPFFKNRLTFALKNKFGDVVGFSARTLKDDGPKYINSGESQTFAKSKLFYNINNASEVIKKEKEVYITEGFMDVIALHKSGLDNSVAIMGTALTLDHIKILKDKKVILMLDSDKAGIAATLKSLNLLLNNNIFAYVIYSKDGKDPDDIFQEEGKIGVKKIIENKVTSFQFIYAVEKKKVDTTNPQGINSFITNFAKYLMKATSLEKDFYINKISKEFNLRTETINAKIPNHKITHINLPKPKKQIDNKSNNNEIKIINNSYTLIRSMLKKPMLVDLFVEQDFRFKETSLNVIAKYIISVANGKKVNVDEKYKKKILDIKNESNAIVDTKQLFSELMELINKETLDADIILNDVQLREATSSKDKLEQLIRLKKLVKGKKK